MAETVRDIEAAARALYAAADPTGFWAAEDEATRLHYRRQAQQKRTAEMEARRA